MSDPQSTKSKEEREAYERWAVGDRSLPPSDPLSRAKDAPSITNAR